MDQDKNYDQGTEDLAIILAYKGAKDFVYQLNRETIEVKDIEKVLFGSKPNLLEYVNNILNTMHNYIAKIIIDKGLSFTQVELLRKDPDSFKITGFEGEFAIDAKTFFSLKYVYEGDRGIVFEDLENFDDFSEYRPISLVQIKFD